MSAEMRRQNFVNYLRDAHYKPGRAELIDLSGVLSSDFNFNRAMALVRQVAEKGPPADIATHRVLWAPDDVPYGCARIFQALAEVMHNGEIEVFRDEESALKALELDYLTIADLLSGEHFMPQTFGGLAKPVDRRQTSLS